MEFHAHISAPLYPSLAELKLLRIKSQSRQPSSEIEEQKICTEEYWWLKC